MTKVFVLEYRSCVYADCEYTSADNPAIFGIFSTKPDAQRRMQAEVLYRIWRSEDGDNKEGNRKANERAKHLEDWHFFVNEYEMNKSKDVEMMGEIKKLREVNK